MDKTIEDLYNDKGPETMKPYFSGLDPNKFNNQL